jgi:hypothetical protein
MEDEERLNRLTPRERDVYEVWREHSDWSNAQIGRASTCRLHSPVLALADSRTWPTFPHGKKIQGPT